MCERERIIELIESDTLRMRALAAVNTLGLPDWLIAAGFVRNLVWDSLYGTDSKLTDIDVIYFCALDNSKERDITLERQLKDLEPDLPWSVKNQARMHIRNADPPYKNTLDAMGYWPEKQTAIGVKYDDDGRTDLQTSFELSLMFNGEINHNPVKHPDIFWQRIESKRWLSLWPALQAKI